MLVLVPVPVPVLVLVLGNVKTIATDNGPSRGMAHSFLDDSPHEEGKGRHPSREEETLAPQCHTQPDH
jgi:hypothetical protein